MKPFAQGTINLLYHHRNNFQFQTDINGLFKLTAATGFSICASESLDGGGRVYAPMTQKRIVELWQNLPNQHDQIRPGSLYWPCSFLVESPGKYTNSSSPLAAVISPWWGYTDRSFNRIWWYLDCGLHWDEKPLSPAAITLLKIIERR